MCYAPFGKEQKMQHKMRNIHDKQKAISETLPEMREIVSKISASLGRFYAKLLGIYETEKGVYSSQLIFYIFFPVIGRKSVCRLRHCTKCWVA